MYKTAGVLFFFAGSILLMGILTAEIFYPVSYSISQNMISNLGATPPPDSVVREPSAFIFDNSLRICGILLLAGTYLLYKYSKDKRTLSLAFMGLGTFGVGIFPAFHSIAHPISALTAFLGGGVAAVATSKLTKPPFSYIAILFGSISLVFLFLGLFLPDLIVPIMGRGGTERWVAFPLILWLTGFGGYLMGIILPEKLDEEIHNPV